MIAKQNVENNVNSDRRKLRRITSYFGNQIGNCGLEDYHDVKPSG